jgi:hypothetical protein
MADIFSNENAFIFVPSPLTTAKLRAIVEGMESDAELHPVNEEYPTNVAVRRVFDGIGKGENNKDINGYVITYGALKAGTQPVRVDVVTGADDAAKVEAARTKIGRGGEFIGFADFAAAGGTESAIVFRRAATSPGAGPVVGTLGGIFTSPGHDWLQRLDGLNFTTVTNLNFDGLASHGLRTLNGQALVTVTDADIDTDGSGGSKLKDPKWQKGTSLEQSPNVGCDSRTFPGVVLPPAVLNKFNIRMGDYAIVFYKDRMAACQVYDSGPDEKIGEISVGLAWALGIPPVPRAGASQQERDEVESLAGRKGNNVHDLVTLFFPGSGNRHPASLQVIVQKSAALLQQLTGAPNPPVFA